MTISFLWQMLVHSSHKAEHQNDGRRSVSFGTINSSRQAFEKISWPHPQHFFQDAATLSRFVMSSTHDHDLVILLNAIATSCKLITSAVQRAGVAKLYGLAGDVNSTGDDQKKLDVLSNDMMINALKNSGVCCVLVSEENEEPIIVPAGRAGKFCVAFDPLDGSSNIDCNVSVGTIFSVYERKPGSDGTVDDLLRTGADCICAGYVAYSSAVELVFTFKGGDVHGFCLDSTIGEFVHTREKMVFPQDGGKMIFSCNEGNSEKWDEVRWCCAMEMCKVSSVCIAHQKNCGRIQDGSKTIQRPLCWVNGGGHSPNDSLRRNLPLPS